MKARSGLGCGLSAPDLQGKDNQRKQDKNFVAGTGI